MQVKKVLITGVAGLLGSRLADWISEHHPDVKIVGIDDLSGGYIENVNQNVNLFIMDMGNTSLKEVFAQRGPFDIVYHFAAYAAEGLSPFIRKHNYINNLVVTSEVINNCITYGCRRLVFTSSMAVYGHGWPPFDEGDFRNPIDPYGIAKAACEQDIEVAGHQHGLDWCIIRPHNVYGAKQNIWDSYRNFIGIAIYKGLIGDPVTIYGTGEQTRAFSYIDDSLPCLWEAGINPMASKEIINLGGIEETSILNVANIVNDLCGCGVVFLPERHEVRHAFSTWSKSVDILGFEHKTSLTDGIHKMWDWAKQQPKRDRFVWKTYEVDAGLYPQWKPEALADGYYKRWR